MKHFARLIEALDQTNKVNARITALVRYFREEDPKDIMWAIALLTGKRPKRPVSTSLLRMWAAELSGVPDWLFEESYHVVGDLAETIALLIPATEISEKKSLCQWMQELMALSEKEEQQKKEFVLNAWKSLDYYEKFVFNKLITGGFRIGVSTQLVIKALAKHTGIESNVLAHRLSGNWQPENLTYEALVGDSDLSPHTSQPYPFCLAYPVEGALEELGTPTDWIAEYKWDGIRGQLIKRNGTYYLWSRGEELITDKFPEYASFTSLLPEGTVLDGEIIPMQLQRPMPFQYLQKRIGRKNITKKMLEDIPVHFIAYDLLEWEGKDIRSWPFEKRRHQLEKVVSQVNHERLILSPEMFFESWEELTTAQASTRELGAEGFMLKSIHSAYHTGRMKGDWWKWKLEPLTIDAVLIYAMAGHGRRANLYTDYTFAVWKEESLVPFTKAYSGLTDKEFQEVDAFVRKNTVEKFGPVRSVKPELVFEIAFEGIQASSRHKSGIALRFPRMKRWRKDKSAREANKLEDLQELLKQYQK
jgi:DNA ligase-1